LKSKNDRAIAHVVLATGISSVVTQLLTIRELLTQFEGNEIIIALILFGWLILGGIGTLAAHTVSRGRWKVTRKRLGWLSFCLAAIAPLQIIAIRLLRDFFFIHGASVGFYSTLGYIFCLITPYCLILGFVLPYSLFVLRAQAPEYPGARIYILDNLGDISGGALFSFALVFIFSPLQAVFLAHLPLLVTTMFLFPAGKRLRPGPILAAGLGLALLTGGMFIEKTSLEPVEGDLVDYRESLYGRITVHRDREQLTIFEDGIPLFSSQNLIMAEESIHYPLAQVKNPKDILLISAEGGVMEELAKYAPRTIDYVELNPEVTRVLFGFGLIEKIAGLEVIHRDGRAYLADTDKIYDAIIVNLPEPDTFQVNRFFTGDFFRLVQKHLSPAGVLSFSTQGFDNYLAEPQRQKISSLYNTATDYFDHVLLLPGQRIFFLCSAQALSTDIPARLASKGINTAYIQGYYYGNLTQQRIKRLNELVDPQTPKNYDTRPHLMRIMFQQWFAKFETSPAGFIIILAVGCLIYLIRITREEFVLFSTGCMTMGSEILVIFAFQIFFGYIYFQIGIIITVFLAGLLPGAVFGNKLNVKGKLLLPAADGVLIILMGIFILALDAGGERLPVMFFLTFGFAVSLVCGFQFPVALRLQGDDNPAATRFFSADLIGAASGTLFTSVVLIPYFGILWAAAALIGLKIISIAVIGVTHEKHIASSVSIL